MVLGQRWILAIEEHQRIVNNNGQFIICQRHFDASDFTEINGKIILGENAVPSIFSKDNKENESNVTVQIQLPTCRKCYDGSQTKKALQKRILEMDIKHQSEIQSYKYRTACLENQNTRNIARADKERKKNIDIAKENYHLKSELKHQSAIVNSLSNEIEKLKTESENSAYTQNQNVRM